MLTLSNFIFICKDYFQIKGRTTEQSIFSIYNYILIKMKITKIHSEVPYLTSSKPGRETKYKRTLMKRKLFKIYVLDS